MPGPTRLLEPLRAFLREEAAGGILLMLAAAVALVIVNSPLAPAWDQLWHTQVGVTVGERTWGMSLAHWVNDGLMAVFFLVVGLEIKREFVLGELREPGAAAVPIAAAIGGAMVPAAIFLVLNATGSGRHGWGVPMATDIAFALGVLALVGPRVPTAIKVFLATLAIVDDLIAVLVIAVFYTGSIELLGIVEALVCITLLLVANRLGVRSLVVYGALGMALWVGVLMSGVHATVAGVLLALTIPATVGQRPDDGRPTRSPLVAMEQRLHPWSAFLIVPVFALANAGVPLMGDVAILAEPVTLGIILGLLVGKPMGILGMTWLLGRFVRRAPPEGTTWGQMAALGVLGGIGFTMSLFIAELATLSADEHHGAKVGILVASVVAGTLGWVAMRLATRPQPS